MTGDFRKNEAVKLMIHSSPMQLPSEPTGKTAPRRRRVRLRLSFQERLLRNSCLACAVLLGVLALGNVNQPWAKKAAAGVEKALTMKVDLDRTLGQLSFVKKLMPESALVFFDLAAEGELLRPVQGTLSHAFSADQPWLMFSCAENEPVCLPADGVISAVSPLSDGGYGVLIDHGEALESVLAGLDEINVQVGDELIRSSQLGLCSGELYYEMRVGGEVCDPTEKMKL